MGSKLSSSRNNGFNATDLERGVALGGRRIRPPWMRVLHRVPQGLRVNKERVYDPSIMSLGPYHHGRPQLRQLEEFKEKVVKVMLKEEERRLLFRGKILERIDDIRHFYGGLSTDEFNDDVLADMMLRDACTLLYWLELDAREEGVMEKVVLVHKLLGVYQTGRVWDDIAKLENQIPWWLVKSLIRFAYVDDEEGEELIRRLFSIRVSGISTDLKQIPWERNGDEYNPLHFLEAIRNTSLIAAGKIDTGAMKKNSSRATLDPGKRSLRSVSELKAKGIYFRPTSRFLHDISFTSYCVFGVLHLPVLVVQRSSTIAFSNIMALEMSPATPCTDFMFTSYLTFMKSMIESSEDVKLLQEKGIIVSFMEDNEEIVRMFREMMDNYGVNMLPFYDEMKIRVNQHCDSKAKTWIADLFNTNFSSPWTVVTFLAATLLLCLTFLQTYYSINPK